jgi:hypothetical protein
MLLRDGIYQVCDRVLEIDEDGGGVEEEVG